jgi:organic hydroperoxide reductase OsmC/OhrA
MSSNHLATIRWSRHDAPFIDQRYSREHQWQFDGGLSVQASSSPHSVPVPMSNASVVDPEEAFVASLSSCHMLWFLHLAAKDGWVVDSYVDEAVGCLKTTVQKVIWMETVTLHPHTTFFGDQPTIDQLTQLHHLAHQKCFLAHSVKSEIIIKIKQLANSSIDCL